MASSSSVASSTNTKTETSTSSSSKSYCTYVYDNPTLEASESQHWKELPHQSQDRLIHNLEQLKDAFSKAFVEKEGSKQQQENSKNDNQDDGRILALWSCLLGYCEALSSTNKSCDKRYKIYPIPIDALRRLTLDEFVFPLDDVVTIENKSNEMDPHRCTVNQVSNFVWSNAISKTNIKDELHANSLYINLRGKIDNKSVDCFGAAICTVIAMRCLGNDSILTLSEDHAYESHPSINNDDDNKLELDTSEVAIPGNTKAQKAKRGQDIAKTFKDSKHETTPETSWLYMGKNPVYCRNRQMIIASAIGNLNCTISETKNSNSSSSSNVNNSSKEVVYSSEMYDIKRDLLWILYDNGYLKTFPFALCELGDCEENCTSKRGEELVPMSRLFSKYYCISNEEQSGSDNEYILKMEELYHEAIHISKQLYNDGQVYPYCYPGHFHKDGGVSSEIDNEAEEYRLVEALRCYYEASRICSRYKYEWGDSLQLTKVITKLSECIVHEILSVSTSATIVCGTINADTTSSRKKKQQQQQARKWFGRQNAVAACTWIMGYIDSLCVWEEYTGKQFLSNILAPDSSKSPLCVGKMLSLISQDIRCEAVKIILDSSQKHQQQQSNSPAPPNDTVASLATSSISDTTSTNSIASTSSSIPITSSRLQYFTSFRSRRLLNGTNSSQKPLLLAIQRCKVTINDLELAIPCDDEDTDTCDGSTSRRSSKRSRKRKKI